MSSSMTLNVRVNGLLGQFVAANVGDDGTYENISEYVRDLIRKDKERAEAVIFDRLKAELGAAFAAPEDTYVALTSNELIARNQDRHTA